MALKPGRHPLLTNLVYQPGLRIAVQYSDDPGWLHERLILWKVAKDRIVVATPDGDV